MIDCLISELTDCFNEENTVLLLFVAYLDLGDTIGSLDEDVLISPTQLFFFSQIFVNNLILLDAQLDTYILDIRPTLELSKITRTDVFTLQLVDEKMSFIHSSVCS